MSIEKDLEQVREIFLTEVDEETLKQNKEEIDSWNQSLIENKAYLEWQSSDITRSISRQAQESYKDASMSLALKRDLTDIDRNKLYAVQDACTFILSLTDKNAKESLEQLSKQIKQALRVVS